MKRSEAGSGGKVGHSRMSHYAKTAEVKDDARRIRRTNDRESILEELRDEARSERRWVLEDEV